MAGMIMNMGEVAKIKGEFRTPADAVPPKALIDPTTVTLTIRRPDKTTEVRTYGVSGIDRLETGKYLALVPLDQEGTYYWKWRGANGVTAAGVSTGSIDSRQEPNF